MTVRRLLEIADSLAKSDPGNANWQHDLSLFYQKVGDVELQQGVKIDRVKLQQGQRIDDAEIDQGQIAQALESYRAGLAIAERLAKSDPSNTDWQRNLALGYMRLGSVYAAQNDSAKARDAFKAGRAIIVRLVELSPQNAVSKNLLPMFDSMLATINP